MRLLAERVGAVLGPGHDSEVWPSFRRKRGPEAALRVAGVLV